MEFKYGTMPIRYVTCVAQTVGKWQERNFMKRLVYLILLTESRNDTSSTWGFEFISLILFSLQGTEICPSKHIAGVCSFGELYGQLSVWRYYTR